jgi:hypothetical protein
MDVPHSWGTIFTWPAYISGLHIISFLLCDLACSKSLTLEHSSNQTRTACLASVHSRLILHRAVDLWHMKAQLKS